MAVTNQEVLDAALVLFQTDLDAGVAEGLTEHNFESYVRRVEPNKVYTDPVSQERKLIWFDEDGELDEDNGDVRFHDNPAQQQSMVIKPYSKGYRETMQRLREPMIREAHARRMQRTGTRITYTQYKAVWDRLNLGDTSAYGLAHDGQFFFDTDHPGVDASGTATTFSNDYALALSAANLKTIIDAMSEFRNPFGIPWGNQWKSATMMPQESLEMRKATPSFHIAVGPKNQTLVADIANMALASPSIFGGTFSWSVEAPISGDYDDDWFVMFNSSRRRPLLFIDAGSYIDEKSDPGSEPGRLKNEAQWVVRSEFGLAYGEWHCIARSHP